MKNLYDLIKKYDKIVIARHIGGDPDAIGSTFALKDIIKANFRDKEVLVIGSQVAKFKVLGEHDKMDESFYDGLLIALDIPDKKRLDGADVSRFKEIIKVDHHPSIDEYSKNDIVDTEASSACEIITDFCLKNDLIITKSAAEKLFIGIIADTNRFLFHADKPSTYNMITKLINRCHINPNKLYEILYRRSLGEVRLEGFISLNMKLTENGLGYIKVTDEDLKKFNLDSASIGGIMNEYNYIDGLLAWVFFTEDRKNGVIRSSARSRGPVINKLFEQYNGGGHEMASGAKLQSFKEADEIIDKLDKMCKEYREGE